MKYDRSLREVLGSIPKEFIKVLVNKAPKQFLDISFPTTKEFRVDLLVLLEDDSIFHLEVQTKNDKTMAIRMLQYYSFIKEKYEDKEITQMVLFLGDDEIKMKNVIKDRLMNYSFLLKDIKEIDCKKLINSDDVNDNILAVLCKIDKVEEFWNKLSNKILSLPKDLRESYIKKVYIFLGLRPVIKKQIKELKVPIVYDLRKDPNFQEGLYEGLQEGIQKGIQKGIQGMYNMGIQKEKIATIFDISIKEVDEMLEDIEKKS